MDLIMLLVLSVSIKLLSKIDQTLCS